MEPPLTVDLIPSTSWWNNARTNLTPGEWDRLRKAQYKAAGFKCEICGGNGKEQGCRWPLECHEVWEYEESTQTQRLVRLIALCPRCHSIKHLGRTWSLHPEKIAQTLQHLMMINGWTYDQVKVHIENAFKIWNQRSQHPWQLDISVLTGA